VYHVLTANCAPTLKITIVLHMMFFRYYVMSYSFLDGLLE